MRSPFSRRLAGAALALGLAASLVACTGSDPEPTALPSKSEAAPVFASDEEAFAAAEEAYARYLKVDMEVSGRFGAEPEAYESVATGEALDGAFEDAAEFAEIQWRTEGKLEFKVADRVEYFETRDRGAVIQLNLCEDNSEVTVWRADGSQVTPGDGARVFPYVVTVEGVSASELRVSDRWQHGTFCF